MKMTRVSLLLAIVATATAVTAAAKPAGKFLQLPADELKWEEFYPGGPVESFIVGPRRPSTAQPPSSSSSSPASLQP